MHMRTILATRPPPSFRLVRPTTHAKTTRTPCIYTHKQADRAAHGLPDLGEATLQHMLLVEQQGGLDEDEESQGRRRRWLAEQQEQQQEGDDGGDGTVRDEAWEGEDGGLRTYRCVLLFCFFGGEGGLDCFVPLLIELEYHLKIGPTRSTTPPPLPPRSQPGGSGSGSCCMCRRRSRRCCRTRSCGR